MVGKILVAHFERHLLFRPGWTREEVHIPANNNSGYRKILKISSGAYIFQRPFLRGLYSEGLTYGRKFTLQNRLG